MHPAVSLPVTPAALRVRWFMAIAWVVIVVKCIVLWWAIEHWRMPFHPLWVVAPTIAFAALASVLWLTHHEE